MPTPSSPGKHHRQNFRRIEEARQRRTLTGESSAHEHLASVRQRIASVHVLREEMLIRRIAAAANKRNQPLPAMCVSRQDKVKGELPVNLRALGGSTSISAASIIRKSAPTINHAATLIRYRLPFTRKRLSKANSRGRPQRVLRGPKWRHKPRRKATVRLPASGRSRSKRSRTS